jgi:hypothetical protein
MEKKSYSPGMNEPMAPRIVPGDPPKQPEAKPGTNMPEPHTVIPPVA